MGKKLRSPVMTGSMSANTLAAHWPDGFLQVAEGAARYGTQYWIGDCADDTWREAAASYPIRHPGRETLAGQAAHAHLLETRRGHGRLRRRHGF